MGVWLVCYRHAFACFVNQGVQKQRQPSSKEHTQCPDSNEKDKDSLEKLLVVVLDQE